MGLGLHFLDVSDSSRGCCTPRTAPGLPELTQPVNTIRASGQRADGPGPPEADERVRRQVRGPIRPACILDCLSEPSLRFFSLRACGSLSASLSKYIYRTFSGCIYFFPQNAFV